MSNMTNNQLLELIDETIEWANEVAEKWAGTIHADVIDLRVTQILMACHENDLTTAKIETFDLAQMLEVAEREYETVEG